MARKQDVKYNIGTAFEPLRNPSTVKELAAQIIIAADRYSGREISEKVFRELMTHYASYHGKKLFSGNRINPTVLNRIGKKRTELLDIMLKGFQTTLF